VISSDTRAGIEYGTAFVDLVIWHPRSSVSCYIELSSIADEARSVD